MDESQRLRRLSKKGRSELGDGDGDGDGGEAAAAASTFMSDVSDDLLLEILIRLPDARAVIQFSSVCNRWFSLVSRSVLYFIHEFNHHHRRRRRLSGPGSELPYTLLRRGTYSASGSSLCSHDTPCRHLFSPDKSKIFRPSSLSVPSSSRYLDHNLDWPWPSPSPPPQPRVFSSFDDLLLVGLSRRKLYVCNPVTRQQALLPDPPAHEHTQTGQWNESRFRSPVRLYFWHCAPVGSHGIMYRPFGENNFEGIVAFDPFKGAADSQRCRLISLPVEFGRGWRDKCNRVRLGVVRGRLRLCQFYWDKKADYFVLKAWELLDATMSSSSSSSSSWNLVHHVRLRRRDETMSLFLIALHPEDGDVFFFTRIVGGDRDICQYNIRRYDYEYVCEFPKSIGYDLHSLCILTLVYPWWPTTIPVLLGTN
ncbi:F-box domain containing protein [Trema orientale]|uniref:F-box domain containing protein n=1 Tax=Trema orientale TaxID=63057 RepID=A0A2P5FV83_TREOI|nr:F-box domain containing protein [Trema orientale]